MPIKTPTNAVNLTGAQTVAGVKTFSSFPVGPSSAPTTDYQLSNKKYVDDAAIAGGVGFGGFSSIVVGANAPTKIRDWASAAHGVYGDIVALADGTNDYFEINAAIAALTAARTWKETVKLIGDFDPNGSIALESMMVLDMSEASLLWDKSGDTLIEGLGTIGATDGVDMTHITASHKGDAILTVDEDIFAIGDYVQICDETVFNSLHRNGEIHRITAVSAGSITLDSSLWLDYTSTPKAKLVSTVHDFDIIGGQIIGASATQDVEMYVATFTYCADFAVRGMNINKVSDCGIWSLSSVAGDISNNNIWGEGRADAGYGVVVSGASNQVNVHHNRIRYCRHAISGGHYGWTSGTAGYYGAPLGCQFNNNLCVGGMIGQGATVIDMHDCNSWGCTFDFNTIIATEDVNYKGISSGAPQWSARGNIINTTGYAIADRANLVRFVTLNDNTILGLNGIALDSTALENVTIDGVDIPVALTKESAILLHTHVADSKAKVSNVIAREGLSGSYYIVSVDGFKSVDIQGNDLRKGHLAGLYVTGATRGQIAHNILANNGQGGHSTTGYQAGAYLVSCTGLVIDHNQPYDDQGAPTQKYGIQEGSGCDSNVITFNKGAGNTTALIYRTGASTIVSEDGGLTKTIEHHTADDTLTLGETGSIHTNLGEDGAQTITLPASAPAGTYFTFVVLVAAALNVAISAASKKFYANGTISTDDGGADLIITADDEGEAITLTADGNGNWIVSAMNGTWTVSQP